MNKYTKKKKNSVKKPIKSPLEIVKLSNYLNLAILIRILWTVYGWRDKRIAVFLEAYLSLMGEIADRRTSVTKMVESTKEMTGVDVVKLIDSLYVGGDNDD